MDKRERPHHEAQNLLEYAKVPAGIDASLLKISQIVSEIAFDFTESQQASYNYQKNILYE